MSSKVRVFLALSVVALALLLIALPQTRLTAQDATQVEYGAAIVGNVPAEGIQAGFIFPGTVGDLVTIRATGISAGMDPNLTLLGPAQELLVSNDNSLSNPSSTASEVVYRLLATGNYTALVGGTPGDFLLTISVRPAVTVTVLQPDTPAQLSLPAATGVQVFSFNTDPFSATSLLIDADPIDVNALIEVRDATGALVATLHNNLDNACLSLGPGDELAEITIAAAPEATGTLTVTLGRGPCQLGPAPEPVTVAPAVLQFQPVAIDGVCAASTIYNLNVRSGPGLQYPALFVNAARQPLQVIGVSADGQWYAVQTAGGIQGWVALPIVVIVGPCDPINVVEAAPAPEASPTPGLPVTTPTVEMTATLDPALTPTATLDPAQPTVTPDPAQPTVVPTVDPAQPTATLPPEEGEPTVTPEPPAEESEATEAA